jgi:regulator of RNase E activity RraA
VGSLENKSWFGVIIRGEVRSVGRLTNMGFTHSVSGFDGRDSD